MKHLDGCPDDMRSVQATLDRLDKLREEAGDEMAVPV